MNDPNELCELHRLDDYEVLSDVALMLEDRGIEADVWPEKARRSVPWASRSSRLMIRCRDLVYARWVAAAAGLDTWPEAFPDEDG
jgi:hypothetical protein